MVGELHQGLLWWEAGFRKLIVDGNGCFIVCRMDGGYVLWDQIVGVDESFQLHPEGALFPSSNFDFSASSNICVIMVDYNSKG